MNRDGQLPNWLRFRLRADAGNKDAALNGPAPGRPRYLRLQYLAVLGLTAILLAAFAALLALPTQAQAQAQAQTTITLVSNTGEARTSHTQYVPHAQRFITGATATEFIISEVQIWLAVAVGKDTTIMIKEDDGNNRPGDLVATLTNPGTLTSNSLNMFTAPAGTTLAGDTSYWITVNEGLSYEDTVTFPLTHSDAQTGETGWSIDDSLRWKFTQTTHWYTRSESLLIAIRSTTGSTASTDATLSDLTLVGVDGNAGALDPTFESNTTNYTALVPNSTDSVTLTATKNDGNATVTISDDDDTSTPNEAELGLNVGSNTLTVTVTAEDGSTTQTYTVTVTRAVEPGRVLVSKKVLTITEGTFGHYTLVLDSQPAGNVVVAISPSNPEAIPTSTTLGFTTLNWNTPQRVTVTAIRDVDTSNETFTLNHESFSGDDSRFAGITIPSVTVNVDDTEAPNYHLRSILVPYDLALGEKALPEEEINVWAGYPFYQNMYVVAEGDRWSPSGVWADPSQDTIWVVDPIHFGIHALKLSALKDGRVERHVAVDTSEFDYRFNYNCHFKRTRASGYHGNPALTAMWGDDSTIWVVNDERGQLDAYRRNGSSTSGCYTDNVTGRDDSGTAVTAREDFKTPFTRDTSKDYLLPQAGYGRLHVSGIWSNGTKIWVGGPGGIYNINLRTSRTFKAPGFNGHNGGTNGLWSDGSTMWVASRAWLRAYELNTGIRAPKLDVQLHRNLEPDGMWSDGATIWVTHRSGSIEAYRLPTGPAAVWQATEADPLTASFALVPELHDGESGFTFRIAFSEDVEITPEDIRDHALLVSGGTVTDAQQVDDRKDLWELTVEPAGTGPLSILVHSGRACTETGALCTADGRSLTSALALRVPGPPAPQANSVATGAPTISGPTQVGETLTASTLGITDDDGLTNVIYSHQWVRNDGSTDTDITGATGETYPLADVDEGNTIRVKVNFTDDADNEETLTSAATAEVAAAVPTDPPGRPLNLTGAANVDGMVTLSWDAPNDDTVTGYRILRRRPQEGEKTLLVHVNDTGSTATEYTDRDVTLDVRHTYRVKAINAVGISKWSNYVRVTPTQPVESSQNGPATGRPTINGTAQLGEELTASTSGIADADGFDNAVFGYQWLADDVAIQGATGSSYTLVDADEGQSIKVTVSFTDDAGNSESLTSVATNEVAHAGPTEPPPAPENLTAVEHTDGSVTLTWDAPDDDTVTGYQIMRRNAVEDSIIVLVENTGNDGISYTDTDVAAGTKYFYRVKAINEAGVGPQSRRVAITTSD